MQTISLLGATGSIGRSAVDVIRRHPERWRVKSVAGGSRIPELVEAVRATHAEQAAVADPAKQGALRAALDAAAAMTSRRSPAQMPLKRSPRIRRRMPYCRRLWVLPGWRPPLLLLVRANG